MAVVYDHDDHPRSSASRIAVILAIIALALAWLAYNRTGKDLEDSAGDAVKTIQEGSSDAGQAAQEGADAVEQGVDTGPDGVDDGAQ